MPLEGTPTIRSPGTIPSPVTIFSFFWTPRQVPARSRPFTSPRSVAVSPPTMFIFASLAPSFNPRPICSIFSIERASVAM